MDVVCQVKFACLCCELDIIVFDGSFIDPKELLRDWLCIYVVVQLRHIGEVVDQSPHVAGLLVHVIHEPENMFAIPFWVLTHVDDLLPSKSEDTLLPEGSIQRQLRQDQSPESIHIESLSLAGRVIVKRFAVRII